MPNECDDISSNQVSRKSNLSEPQVSVIKALNSPTEGLEDKFLLLMELIVKNIRNAHKNLFSVILNFNIPSPGCISAHLTCSVTRVPAQDVSNCVIIYIHFKYY